MRKNQLTQVQKNGYSECADCGGLIISGDCEWCGEDENGIGWVRCVDRCERCFRWSETYITG